MTLIGDPIIMYTTRIAHTLLIVVYRKIRQNSEEIYFATCPRYILHNQLYILRIIYYCTS